MLALPGGAYIYQGEELGLPEVTDIPKDRLEDPRWHMSGFTDPGRDGCRVPIPWTSSKDGAHGFSTRQSLAPVDAWLPQPKGWGDFAVDKQEQSQHSTLWLYRKALKIRQNEEGLGDGEMEWIKQGEKVVAFSRPGGFQCWVNFGKTIKIPKGSKVLLSSIPLEGRKLPKDAAVWFKA
jgi:alpha-glucosidase